MTSLCPYRAGKDGATLRSPQSSGGLRSSLLASPPGGWGSFVSGHLRGSVIVNDERTTEATA